MDLIDLNDFAVCFMQQDITYTKVWTITCFFASTRIWYHTHIYTYKDTVHTGANRLTDPNKYISIPPVMWSQQSSALQWIICWYQTFTFHNGFASQNYSLTENTYLLIRFNKTKFRPRNTNTDGNGVNEKTQKGMSNNQRKITLKRVSIKVNDTPLF